MRLDHAFAFTALASLARGAVLGRGSCNHDNCLRQVLEPSNSVVTAFCGTYTTAVNTAKTGLPTFVSMCSGSPSRISSACSCAVSTSTGTSTSSTTVPTSSSSLSSGSTTASGSPTPTGTLMVSVPATPIVFASSTNLATTASTAAPTQTALPMRLGPWDGSNNTLDSIKSAPTKNLLYGVSNNDNSYFLSIVSLTSNTSALINLEDFAPFISSISCLPASIAITFTNSAGYSTASTDWKAGMGIVTSGTSNCGVESDRTYFQLNSTTPGNLANSLVLNVTPANISSVVDQVSATFGTLQPSQISPTGPALGTALQNVWEPIQNWFNQGSGSSQRRDSYSKSTTWNINPSIFDQFVEGFESTFPIPYEDQITVLCQGLCGLTADITMGGTLDYKSWDDVDMSLYSDINNVQASLNLLISASTGFGVDSTWTLASVDLIGFEVPGFLTADITADLIGGIQIEASSFIEIAQVGFNMTAPDSGWSIDLSGNPKPSAYGWTAPTAVWIPLELELTQSYAEVVGYLAPTIEATIGIGDSLQSLLNAAINLLNFGYFLAGEPTISVPDLTWTASVGIEVPKLIVDLTQVTEGTCFNPNDNQNYEVDFFIGASLNAGLTGYEVPSSMNDVDLLGEFGVPELKWQIPTSQPVCANFNFD